MRHEANKLTHLCTAEVVTVDVFHLGIYVSCVRLYVPIQFECLRLS